ncbi:MAG: hypothetical protein AAGA37_20910 [Actinomycetota bacterium]
MSLTLIRTLAFGTALSLGAVACGSGDSDTESSSADTSNEIATLSDDSTETVDVDATESSASTSSDEREAPEDIELAFALFDECMAEFGIDMQTSMAGEGDEGLSIEEETIELDDPQAGAGDLGDFNMEDFDAANAECEKHLANTDVGFDMSPEQEALFEDAQIEWSNCMRERGIDIPDMDSSGGGAIIIDAGTEADDPQAGDGFSGDNFDFEAFEKASAECEYAFDALSDVFEGAEG